jgi:adenine phosphoribosyltransferase
MNEQMNAEAELRKFIRDIPDFPKPGILFRDLTPLLADAGALRLAVEAMAEPFRGESVDCVVGTEARGFIFGAPVAMELGVGFVPARKPGKLPHDTFQASYELEYGTDHVEMHVDAVGPGSRVLVVDDLIATGGTAGATIDLVRQSGAEVAGCAFLIELTFLEGRGTLDVEPCHAVIRY